jgi:hypothetical protein
MGKGCQWEGEGLGVEVIGGYGREVVTLTSLFGIKEAQRRIDSDQTG